MLVDGDDPVGAAHSDPADASRIDSLQHGANGRCCGLPPRLRILLGLAGSGARHLVLDDGSAPVTAIDREQPRLRTAPADVETDEEGVGHRAAVPFSPSAAETAGP
jgi:hypothetical protein